MNCERILELRKMDLEHMPFKAWMIGTIRDTKFPRAMGLAHHDQVVRLADLGYRTGARWKEGVLDVVGADMLPGVENVIRAMPTVRPDAWRALRVDGVWRIDFVEVIVSHRPTAKTIRAYRDLFDACGRGKRIIFECWKLDEFGSLGPLVTAETREAL